MSSGASCHIKHVRTFKQSEHVLSVVIRNDLGRLLAVGHCSCSDNYPQIFLNNFCLSVELYGYELQRWLYTAMFWLRGDKASANFEAEETLFPEDYLV